MNTIDTTTALDSASLDEIDAAIAAQIDVAAQAEQAAQEADAAALNPRASAADAAKRRKAADDARFNAERAGAALEALRAHRDATAKAQAEDASRARYQVARSRYTAALDEMEAEWNATVEKLVAMAQEHETARSEMMRTKRADYEGFDDPRAAEAGRALRDINLNRMGGTPAVSSASGVTLRFYG